jgi:probable rRNA maturation factor
MSARVELVVSIENDGWASLDAPEALAMRAAKAGLDAASPDSGAGTLTLVLSGDDEVRDLNLRWRGLDKPTNVLSFPSEDEAFPGGPPPHFGDVILAWETVAREAAEQNKPVAAHASHLIVHGVLHLFGYDHQDDDDASVMETLETRILAGLGISDPYAVDKVPA